MRRVFLSYRRDDSQTISAFIYQHLEDPAAFGPGSVFMDIDDIPDGVDFRQVIDEAMGKCEFFLAVIGRRWVSDRLKNPNDFVRLEIEAALRREIPVTPVLVDGATMPTVADLPGSIHALLYRNARTLRPGKDFRTDVLLMVERLHTAKKWIAERDTPIQPPVEQATTSSRQTTPPHLGHDEKAVPTKSKDDLVKLIAATPVRQASEQFILDLGNGIRMRFAYCPPGEFQMGSSVAEQEAAKKLRWDASDEQQHLVRLTNGFYAGVHPVTQEQWVEVMGTNPSNFTGDTLPVEEVNWDEAHSFCAAVKTRTGQILRLPTEAEWEYACRAGTTTEYHSGDGAGALMEVGWYGPDDIGMLKPGQYTGNANGETHAAGRLKPNAWGLYDCHGNVCEWCADWKDDGYYERSPVADPTGAKTGMYRVMRGGSWSTPRWRCRSACRDKGRPDLRLPGLGFRVIAVLSGQ